MNGEEMFAAMGEIDEALLPPVRVRHKTQRNENEYTADPHRRSGKWIGGAAVACVVLLVSGALFLGWLFSQPVEWGVEGTAAWTGSCVIYPSDHTHPEDTQPYVDPIPEPSFRLCLGSMEEYRVLMNALNLSDEELVVFLEENGYEDMNLTTRGQLETVKSVMEAMPIPMLGHELPEEICVYDYSSMVEFSFDGVVMAVQKLQSADTVSHKTRGMGLVWQYTSYPLYFGSVSEAGGVVTARYVLNADDHAVEIEVKAASQEETLIMLEDLRFGYLTDMPRGGVYRKEGNINEELLLPEIYLNMQTGSFTASASRAHSYAEFGAFTVRDGQLTATTQSATFVFLILKDESLLVADDGGFGLWIKKGDIYRWVDE